MLVTSILLRSGRFANLFTDKQIYSSTRTLIVSVVPIIPGC